MIDNTKVCEILNRIVEAEMAGVVRYAHSSLMVSGPNRIPIVQFLQEQANESLAHALQAGEFITGFDGHPSQKIARYRLRTTITVYSRFWKRVWSMRNKQ